MQEYDPKCLDGMKKIINKFQPYIIIEIDEIFLNRYSFNSNKLIEMINDMNYSIFNIRKSTINLCIHNDKINGFKHNFSDYIYLNDNNITLI